MSDLTFDILQQLLASVPKGPAELHLIFVEPTPIYGPVRTHHKRRIRKKWRKRYGLQVIGFDHFLGDKVFADEARGIGYCHPDVGQQIQNEIRERKTSR